MSDAHFQHLCSFKHDSAVLSVCFSPDISMLATGEGAGKTKIYNIKTQTKIYRWKHEGDVNSVNSVCFSPDGSMLATGDSDKKTTIYAVNTKSTSNQVDHEDCV